MTRTDFPAMDTMASVLVARADVERLGGERVERAVAAVRRDLSELERRFSQSVVDSEINRWLSGGSVSPDAIADFDHVLRACDRLSDESAGAFGIESAAVGRVDTAGYIKGFGMRRAAQTLRAFDMTNFVIGVGYDLFCSGRPDDSRQWRVAVADPHREDSAIALVDATDLAVATAVMSERGAQFWSRRPAPAPQLRSFTVIGPDIAEADAYATIGFAMGEAGMEWVAERADYRSVVVRSDGEMLSDAALVSAA